MRRCRRLAPWSAALLVVGVSVAVRAQVQYTNNFMHLSGQSVQPIFEGWSRLPDGSFDLHFGYLNRNYVERPIIPVGPLNVIVPSGPDRGQPAFFYNRTHRNVFTVTVPKEWDAKEEVVWTVTHNGKAERAVGWLQPEWEIDPVGGASGGGSTDPERVINTPPTIAINPVQRVRLPATASLLSTVSDDGHPKPRPRGKPATGQDSPTLQGGIEPPVNVPAAVSRDAPGGAPIQRRPGVRPERPPQGLAVSWMLWRGPADVTFEPRWAQPKDGLATTTATFSQPGEYVLRAAAHDGHAITYRNLSVMVTGAASRQP